MPRATTTAPKLRYFRKRITDLDLVAAYRVNRKAKRLELAKWRMVVHGKATEWHEVSSLDGGSVVGFPRVLKDPSGEFQSPA